MKFQINEVKLFLDAHPEINKRRFQYEITSALTGISPETCRKICSIQRIIRMCLPAEEDKHDQETEAMDELGYSAKAISDFSRGKKIPKKKKIEETAKEFIWNLHLKYHHSKKTKKNKLCTNKKCPMFGRLV